MSKKITQAQLLAGMTKLILVINQAYNDPEKTPVITVRNGKEIRRYDRATINAAIRHLYRGAEKAMELPKVRELLETMDVELKLYEEHSTETEGQGQQG